MNITNIELHFVEVCMLVTYFNALIIGLLA